MTADNILCRGCGLVLPDLKLDSPKGFNASGECYQQFNELSFYTLSLGYEEFIHQMAVDAYEAQHAGQGTKNITGTFGLIGLYLSFEKGYNGRQVQRAHMMLANARKDWPCFDPAGKHWPLTVMDVLKSPEGENRDRMLRSWAHAVWDGWRDQHQAVAELVEDYLRFS